LNYNTTIKTSMPENFSCDPTMEEETEDHWGASDIDDEKEDKDAEGGTTENPTISSVTEVKRDSPFTTWCPFIPSNS
jgi:hypothetical protein